MTSNPAFASTPAFARWSLSLNCDFREQASDPFDPIAVERELRPLQEASLARADGRIVDGIAIARDDWTRLRRRDESLNPAEIRGFSVEGILDYYGGRQTANETCAGCPANAWDVNQMPWAGCFGVVMPGWGRSPAEIDGYLESLDAVKHLQEVFLKTAPCWYGWWIDGEWSRNQVESYLDALECGLPEKTSLYMLLDGGERLRVALQRSLRHGFAFRVAAFPPGRIEGRDWIVEAHCPRCKAPAGATARFCRVCRRAGGMFPARVRKARGERPFHPLGKLISRDRIDAIVDAVAGRNDAE